MIIHLIGLFLIILGIALLVEKRKRKKNIETFEGKHNVNIPKPLLIIMIIVGAILLLGTNFHGKVSYTDTNGNEHTVAEYSQENESKDDNQNVEDIVGNNNLTQEETGVQSGEKENADSDQSEDIQKQDEDSSASALKVGNGYVNIPDIPNTTREDNEYLVSFQNDDFNVSYADSFIDVGDNTGVDNWIKIYEADTENYDVSNNMASINGKTCFVVTTKVNNPALKPNSF